MGMSNSAPRKRRGVEKALAAEFAIVMKGGQRQTIPVNSLKRMLGEGWKRVN